MKCSSLGLPKRVVAGGEATGFDYFASGVEVFRRVDIHEADLSRIGALEIFVGEDRYRRVIGADCFFDRSTWRSFTIGHCVCEVGCPVFPWVDCVQRIEYAF